MDPLDHFEFSQSSLQDFVDCPRRFQLRYLQKVSWPAIQAEPARENEAHIQRGERFHRLAQQYLLGLPEERLTQMAQADLDPNLIRWWQHFLEDIPQRLQGKRYVETTLQSGLAGLRLVAKFDLVLIQPDGQAIIYDWKTSPRKPKRDALLQRLQTRVYQYQLVQAGAAIHQGERFQAEQTQMIYWFAEPDLSPEVILYSDQQQQTDEAYLRSLIEHIRTLKLDEYTLAKDERSCRYCVYRSLCNRGTTAADFSESSDDLESSLEEALNFDFEQINEISF